MQNALAGLYGAPPAPSENALSYYAEGDSSPNALSFNLAKNTPYARPGPYFTQLAPHEEAAFREWIKAKRVRFDPDAPIGDYDMRGFWRQMQQGGAAGTGVNKTDGQLHFSDEFKTPYDASFSAQSRYAQPTAPDWANDYQLVNKAGRPVYDEAYINRQRVLSGQSRNGSDGVGEQLPLSAADIAHYFTTGVGR